MKFANRIFSDLSALLFPDLCGGCGTHLHRGESSLCSRCLTKIPFTDFHLHSENKVARQFWGRIPFHSAMALLYFNKGGTVQNIIHNLKYKHQTHLGLKLGHMIAGQLLKSPNYQHIDLIIPVPLHKKKEKTRGYNQSQLIAEGIAERLNIPVNNKLLIRTHMTETQTKKGRYKRHENMSAVFSVVGKEMLTSLHILLIDDVITTGATIEACAIELHKHGIKKISIAAAAFAE